MKQSSLAAVLMLSATMAMAEGKTHHIAFHVDEGDPQLLNMVLNNVQNVQAYYAAQGDTVVAEVVAYGPGLVMFIEGQSPVGERIKTMALESDTVTFAACGNTLQKMSEKAGKDIPLMEEAQVVPSGVVHLVELQEQGYAYIRP